MPIPVGGVLALLTGVAVYIVDDDDAVRDSLAAILEAHGASVEAFGSGVAVGEAVTGVVHGCLVLDVQLPDMSGIDLLKKLRSDGVDLPAIFVTGRPRPDVRAGADRAGAPLVEKPVDGDEIAGTIAKLMQVSA